VIKVDTHKHNFTGRKDREKASFLTIMFSRACLASQQFRKTGMNKFLREGKIT